MGVLREFSDTPALHARYRDFHGALAFDIGANAGTVAQVLCDNFAQVVACEPSPEPFAHLAARPEKNLTAVQVAVSDHEGTVELLEREMSAETGMYFTGDSLLEWGPETGRHTVPCTTLDVLAGTYGYPDFVKIDTEGHDWLVIQGGSEVFGRAPRFLIEVHDGAQGRLIEAWLSVRGLRFDEVRHEGRTDGSPDWQAHYWLVSR